MTLLELMVQVDDEKEHQVGQEGSELHIVLLLTQDIKDLVMIVLDDLVIRIDLLLHARDQ